MTLIDQVLNLKSTLDQIRSKKSDSLKNLMDELRFKWIYHSNRFDGNSLDYSEAKNLLSKSVTAYKKPLQDHFEILKTNQLIDRINENIENDLEITEETLVEFRKLLRTNVHDIDQQDSSKSLTNYHEDIEHAKILINWYRSEIRKPNLNPISFAADFHCRLANIQPSNLNYGKIARLMMNCIVMKWGYPPIIIKENEKEEYYTILKSTSSGDSTPFYEYILQKLVEPLQTLITQSKAYHTIDFDDEQLRLLKEKIKNSFTPTVHEKKIISEEGLQVFYNESLKDLWETYSEVSEKFEHFYESVEFMIDVDGEYDDDNRPYEGLAPFLNENISTFNMRSEFYDLKNVGSGTYFYADGLIIKLICPDKYTLSLINHPEPLFTKELTAPISKEELGSIRNQLAWDHKCFIDKKIEESTEYY